MCTVCKSGLLPSSVRDRIVKDKEITYVYTISAGVSGVGLFKGMQVTKCLVTLTLEGILVKEG